MKIVEIKISENGSHRNQTINGNVLIPKGFAVIPEDMELKNFPFGNIIVEEIDGIKTVTSWEALPIPEIEEGVNI